MDEQVVYDSTILLCRHGSHAYGLATETSDVDEKGICILSDPKYYFGFSNFAQKDGGWSDGADRQIYDIRKFVSLALACNPNIIEVLFTDESDILSVTPAGERLLSQRDIFLSRRAAQTFVGYAVSQLKRIRGHKKWLDDPPAEPTESQFVHSHLLVPGAVWEREFAEHEIKVETDSSFKVMTPAVVTHRDKQGYKAAHSRWRQYQEWVTNRNPARAAMEAAFTFDCYHEDTEFLTPDGWLRYDAIDSGVEVATVNPSTLRMEMQLPTGRIDKDHDGDLLLFDNQQTRCLVTPGHSMLVSPCRRGGQYDFSTRYDEGQASWELTPAGDLLGGSRSYFHSLNSAAANNDDFPFPESERGDVALRILGAFVSEGSVGGRLSDGSASILRFSQMDGGRLCPVMASIPGLRRFETKRDGKIEVTWTLADRALARWAESCCGHGARNKHLPDWAIHLSNRQAWVLLDSMIAGDGTDRGENRSFVYYTGSKRLADDIQAMCVCAGITTQVWGPYGDHEMYHVYIRKQSLDVQAGILICSDSEVGHVSRISMGTTRVVCFTVPNGTLISRMDGKVSIQGNCKHAMHLVRLLRMGLEIVREGKVIVKRPDRDDLLAIRNGAFSYEELVGRAEESISSIDEALAGSPLPVNPDHEAAESLLMDLVINAVFPTTERGQGAVEPAQEEELVVDDDPVDDEGAML